MKIFAKNVIYLQRDDDASILPRYSSLIFWKEGMNMSKKILIIEDDVLLQRAWKACFESMVDEKGEPIFVLSAVTISEGVRLFRENKETIDLIGMDACVPGSIPNTLDITCDIRRSIRHRFEGPIVAISGDPNYRKKVSHQYL